MDKVKALVCDHTLQIHEAFYDFEASIIEKSKGSGYDAKQKVLASFCTDCNVRYENLQIYLGGCICFMLRSHEICNFCLHLQYKLIFKTIKLWINEKKFRQVSNF